MAVSCSWLLSIQKLYQISTNFGNKKINYLEIVSVCCYARLFGDTIAFQAQQKFENSFSGTAKFSAVNFRPGKISLQSFLL